MTGGDIRAGDALVIAALVGCALAFWLDVGMLSLYWWGAWGAICLAAVITTAALVAGLLPEDEENEATFFSVMLLPLLLLAIAVVIFWVLGGISAVGPSPDATNFGKNFPGYVVLAFALIGAVLVVYSVFVSIRHEGERAGAAWFVGVAAIVLFLLPAFCLLYILPPFRDFPFELPKALAVVTHSMESIVAYTFLAVVGFLLLMLIVSCADLIRERWRDKQGP